MLLHEVVHNLFEKESAKFSCGEVSNNAQIIDR